MCEIHSIVNAETAASKMSMVSSAVCQSALSRVNLHNAGLKKNETRFRTSFETVKTSPLLVRFSRLQVS